MRDLTVALVQADLVWENPRANLAAMDTWLAAVENDPDIVILPEMFTTGFTMNAGKLAQTMHGKSVSRLRQAARKTSRHILGSLIITEAGRYYNRLVWACPDGRIFTYDKRHLFRMMEEHRVYSPGNHRMTVDVDGWRIRPFICYDLRFPIWTRNLDNAYDVAVFIANWPARRAFHWKSLLLARAIENQCYVIGVNRVGMDGNGLEFSGDSAVIDPSGIHLFQQSHSPCIHTHTLSHRGLVEYREAFPAYLDADVTIGPD
jgi:predicted amidohydrolase